MLCNHCQDILSILWLISKFAKVLDDLRSQDKSINEASNSSQIGYLRVGDLDLSESPNDRDEIAES